MILDDVRQLVYRLDIIKRDGAVVRLIREICDQEKPDILVGNSCGSFYTTDEDRSAEQTQIIVKICKYTTKIKIITNFVAYY